jgi:hypothetical protein
VNKVCGAIKKTMLTTMKFVQINLHHSKADMAALCQKLAFRNVDTALIQEPCVCGGGGGQ